MRKKAVKPRPTGAVVRALEARVQRYKRVNNGLGVALKSSAKENKRVYLELQAAINVIKSQQAELRTRQRGLEGIVVARDKVIQAHEVELRDKDDSMEAQRVELVASWDAIESHKVDLHAAKKVIESQKDELGASRERICSLTADLKRAMGAAQRQQGRGWDSLEQVQGLRGEPLGLRVVSHDTSQRPVATTPPTVAEQQQAPKGGHLAVPAEWPYGGGQGSSVAQELRHPSPKPLKIPVACVAEYEPDKQDARWALGSRSYRIGPPGCGHHILVRTLSQMGYA